MMWHPPIHAGHRSTRSLRAAGRGRFRRSCAALCLALVAAGAEAEEFRDRPTGDLLGNEFVRVRIVEIAPGERMQKDIARPHLMYAIDPYSLRHTSRAGVTRDISAASGSTHLLSAGPYTLVNVQHRAARYLEVESRLTALRPDPPGPSAFQLSRAPSLADRAPEYASTLHEDDYFRVTELRLPPGAALPRHQYLNRVAYVMRSQSVHATGEDESADKRPYLDGTVYWRGAEDIAARNSDRGTAHVILIGLKPPQRFRDYEP